MAGDDPLQHVLGLLERVRPVGKGWSARCPAHDDGTNSLTVAAGDGQPVVLKCQAGCDTVQVLAELELTMADLCAPRDERPGAEQSVYAYTDEHGEVLFQVVRYAGKQFRQRKPDGAGGWTWRLGDARRVPYRLPQLLEAAAAGSFAYVAEGEKDVHALEAAGMTATCNPGGASKWRDDYSPYFRGCRAVIVVADRDEPGRRHALQVKDSLERHGVSPVLLVEAASGKDAADHLAAGLSPAQFVPWLPGAGTAPPAPAWEEEDMGKLLALGRPQAPELVAGLLYPEAVHCLAGPPGGGKTTLVTYLMLACLRDGGRVMMLDEESGGQMMRAKLLDLGAVPGEVSPPAFTYLPFPSRRWSASDVEDLHAIVAERRPALIVLDSVAAFLAIAGLDENKADDVTGFWQRVLVPLARDFGAAVVAVDHVTKNGDNGGYSRGSGAKKAASDVQFLLEVVTPFNRSQAGMVRLTTSPGKDRPGWLEVAYEIRVRPGDPMTLEIEKGAASVPDGNVRMKPGKANLLEALEAIASAAAPATRSQLVDWMVARGDRPLTKQVSNRYLSELADEGFADYAAYPGGKGERMWWCTDKLTTPEPGRFRSGSAGSGGDPDDR